MVECDSEASLLQGELVALASTFGEGQSIQIMALESPSGDSVHRDIDDSSSVEDLILPWTLKVRIDPSMCGDVQSYVQFTLVLTVGQDYPEKPDVRVSIEQPKGLDCETERRIRDGLVTYLDDDVLAGELHGCGACIVPMVFRAVELAQECNEPHGACVFCLENLENPDLGGVTKVEPCFHCFCTSCYQSWYQWKQNMIQSRVKELHEEHNKNTMIISKAMEDEGIVESGEYPGQYLVLCPYCRGPVNTIPEHIRVQESTEIMQSVKDLPVALRESVAKLQEQFSKLLTIQKEHNGLIQ